MSASLLSRRLFIQAALWAAAQNPSYAQGFAGLGTGADGFAQVVRGHPLSFPLDHGPHPQFRTEWWYITANLHDANGAAYGAQWTLFRQAMSPAAEKDGWENQQVWMAHAAVTNANVHLSAERFARGGVGQAGVVAKPFQAWIDAWQLRGSDQTSDQTLAPLKMTAATPDFGFDLDLTSSRSLVLQGNAGYSQKSDNGQASYYYSQPFFAVHGEIALGGRRLAVTGLAWLDREWSSQPLSPDQKGWDWIALHLESGEKVMLFRLRQTNGNDFLSGNWIDADGRTNVLGPRDVVMSPLVETAVEGRSVPTQWAIEIPRHGFKVNITALNPRSWMATSIPYWEGPIRIEGSHAGVGYLEATGY